MPINLQDNCTCTFSIDEQFFIGCALGRKRSSKEEGETARYHSPVFEVHLHVVPTFSSPDCHQGNPGAGLLAPLCRNGNLNVGTLLRAYLIAISISQTIFNMEISILVVRPDHSKLCLFGVDRT